MWGFWHGCSVALAPSMLLCVIDYPSGHAMLPTPAPSKRAVPSQVMLQRTGAIAAVSDCIYHQPAATSQGNFSMLPSICRKWAPVWAWLEAASSMQAVKGGCLVPVCCG